MTINRCILAIFLIAGLIGCTKDNPTQTDARLPVVPSMVAVERGMFMMGGDGAYDGKPIHAVTVGAFSIDAYEVTIEQWTAVRTWALAHGYTDAAAGESGGSFSGAFTAGTNDPVTSVNWYDVVKWCNARSEKDGLTPVYYTDSACTTVYRTGDLDLGTNNVAWSANGYRLPTEAEWEFSARGGIHTHGSIYSGGNTIGDVAWHSGNSGGITHPVGTKIPNELGMYDMTGNVWEWCWDLYEEYFEDAQVDPKGAPSGAYRVLRGGSFTNFSTYCRVAFRSGDVPGNRNGNHAFGFRCVKK
jgi:formylglycine-generating enzyme required for sulfatase activity